MLELSSQGRIQGYMTKVREIEDRCKAPRLEKSAVKSFVRNALFDHSTSNEKVNSITDLESLLLKIVNLNFQATKKKSLANNKEHEAEASSARRVKKMKRSEKHTKNKE